ncbi:MAG: YcxB family protein [Coriobacteriia bacterium]|jgi:hypothetical protein|nr:YcxB family protein [Coriobacteriia bacterium]
MSAVVDDDSEGREQERPSDRLVVTVSPNDRGYRRVLLHLAALRLRFVPPVLGLLALLAYSAGARTEAVALFLGALAIPIVVWGYLAWLSKSPRSQSLYATVTYEFTSDNIIYHSSFGEGTIRWDQVLRWREVAEHVLIYVSGSSYLLLPLSDLEEPASACLRETLEQHVGRVDRRSRRIR